MRCLRRQRPVHLAGQVVQRRAPEERRVTRGYVMTVANGRQFLSIPGPTNVPDAVLAAMQRPAIDIYSGEMIGITDSCLADLKALFKTAGRTYIYAANGHGGWEAAFT